MISRAKPMRMVFANFVWQSGRQLLVALKRLPLRGDFIEGTRCGSEEDDPAFELNSEIAGRIRVSRGRGPGPANGAINLSLCQGETTMPDQALPRLRRPPSAREMNRIFAALRLIHGSRLAIRVRHGQSSRRPKFRVRRHRRSSPEDQRGQPVGFLGLRPPATGLVVRPCPPGRTNDGPARVPKSNLGDRRSDRTYRRVVSGVSGRFPFSASPRFGSSGGGGGGGCHRDLACTIPALVHAHLGFSATHLVRCLHLQRQYGHPVRESHTYQRCQRSVARHQYRASRKCHARAAASQIVHNTEPRGCGRLLGFTPRVETRGKHRLFDRRVEDRESH